MKTSARLPRVVVVTRPTLYERMLERHGTAGQADFFLRGQGRSLKDYERAHTEFHTALAQAQAQIPADQRRTHVTRDNLCSFLFAPDDIVLVIGQDGLVPNAAKYLSGQPVVGINPTPGAYDGVLCPFTAGATGELLDWVNRQCPRHDRLRSERRVMAEARTDDGQRLLALNEIFVGHRSHQSAVYRLNSAGKSERQSSSGIICATGTGATGWTRSIVNQRGLRVALPSPEEARLAWFVREPFPSVSTGTSLDHGYVDEKTPLSLVSEMGEGGTLFADGIEPDRIELPSGCGVTLGIAETRLRLITALK